eukprot:1983659-Prymnesium_polylepis.4
MDAFRARQVELSSAMSQAGVLWEGWMHNTVQTFNQTGKMGNSSSSAAEVVHELVSQKHARLEEADREAEERVRNYEKTRESKRRARLVNTDRRCAGTQNHSCNNLHRALDPFIGPNGLVCGSCERLLKHAAPMSQV